MKRSPRMYSRLRYSWIPISAANTEVSVTCRREGQKNAPENVEEKNSRQFSSDSRSTNVRDHSSVSHAYKTDMHSVIMVQLLVW